MGNELTYWERLWRTAVGIPTLFLAILIIASIGGTIGMSYIEWELYLSFPKDMFLGVYDWFATMTPMGWRAFIPIYIFANFVIAWYWEILNTALDDDDKWCDGYR